MTEEKKEKQEKQSPKIMGGSVLIGIGLLFLLVNFNILPPIYKSWPLFLIIIGVSLIINSLYAKRNSE